MYRLPDSASQYLIHRSEQNKLVEKRGEKMQISIGEQTIKRKQNRVLQQFIGATVAPE